MKTAFDTNILIYAADIKAGKRHSSAADFLHRASNANCILPLQSLAEFFTVATRKIGLDLETARGFVEDWQAVFPVHPASEDCLTDAMWAVREHRMSFWDAMLWAAAKEADCRILISEDLQDGQTIGPVTFIDPFADHNEVLLRTALPPLSA